MKPKDDDDIDAECERDRQWVITGPERCLDIITGMRVTGTRNRDTGLIGALVGAFDYRVYLRDDTYYAVMTACPCHAPMIACVKIEDYAKLSDDTKATFGPI